MHTTITAVTRSLFTLLLFVVTLAVARAEPPVPMLWQVGDRVHLLGSMHLLTPEDYPLAPVVEEIFARADKVVFELDPQEAMSPALAQRMVQAGMLAGTDTLRGLVAESTWGLLADYGAGSGMPPAFFERMKPWMVSLVIVMGEVQRAGFRPDLGLDRHLMERAQAAGKATAGLERGEQQIAVFDGLSPAVQEEMLVRTLEQARDPESTRRLHRLWRAGDEAGLVAYIGEELAAYPEVYRAINADRNREWLPRVRQYVDGDQRVLVVVGALHLIGDDGLPALLRETGLRVERIGCDPCR
ncbi:MAG: TraB/GumN family protein [Rehaibacterium terrae]|uniref:TraB/GumN family protein n=1 Tax=Rehaibacterium terrae TaxID=1341696 RepID=UPI00391A9722